MTLKRFDLIWHVGYSKAYNEIPEKSVLAAVPGAVQLDWTKAEGWEDYTISDNFLQYSWMEDLYWTYSTVLEPPYSEDEERLIFVRKGVDYRDGVTKLL